MKRILTLLKPAKWYYCQLASDGRVVYEDSPVFWLRWAQKQNPIVDSIEGFHGDTQVAVLVEFRGCDPRFARTKRPNWRRNFYRVSVLGGPLDGRTREVGTLEQAREQMQAWSHASWTMLDAPESAG